MAPIGLLDILQVFGGVSLLYALYYIHWELTVGASRRVLIRDHGCKPLKSSTELNGFPDNIIGLKTIKEDLQGLKQQRLTEVTRERFLKHGTTICTKVIFTDFIHTIEPENLKTMLALNFKAWSLGDRRKTAFVPLLVTIQKEP